MKRYDPVLTVFLVLLQSTMIMAAERVNIPDLLKPWVDWTLHDHQEQIDCIPSFNNALKLHCNWPSSLNLEINTHSATFNQTWQVEHESWIQLPGERRIWPEKVTINDEPVLILERNGFPQVWVEAGSYQINGAFSWKKMPEYMQVNARTALVALKIRNKEVDNFNLDANGRLWLQSMRKPDKAIQDSLRLEGFRKIDDLIPASVVRKYGFLRKAIPASWKLRVPLVLIRNKPHCRITGETSLRIT